MKSKNNEIVKTTNYLPRMSIMNSEYLPKKLVRKFESLYETAKLKLRKMEK